MSQYAPECLAFGGLLPGRCRIGQSGASTTSCPSGSTCTQRASERGRSPTGTSSGLSGCVSAYCSGHAPHPGARVFPEVAASHAEERRDHNIWRESTDRRPQPVRLAKGTGMLTPSAGLSWGNHAAHRSHVGRYHPFPGCVKLRIGAALTPFAWFLLKTLFF